MAVTRTRNKDQKPGNAQHALDNLFSDDAPTTDTAKPARRPRAKKRTEEELAIRDEEAAAAIAAATAEQEDRGRAQNPPTDSRQKKPRALAAVKEPSLKLSTRPKQAVQVHSTAAPPSNVPEDDVRPDDVPVASESESDTESAPEAGSLPPSDLPEEEWHGIDLDIDNDSGAPQIQKTKLVTVSSSSNASSSSPRVPNKRKLNGQSGDSEDAEVTPPRSLSTPSSKKLKLVKPSGLRNKNKPPASASASQSTLDGLDSEDAVIEQPTDVPPSNLSLIKVRRNAPSINTPTKSAKAAPPSTPVVNTNTRQRRSRAANGTTPKKTRRRFKNEHLPLTKPDDIKRWTKDQLPSLKAVLGHAIQAWNTSGLDLAKVIHRVWTANFKDNQQIVTNSTQDVIYQLSLRAIQVWYSKFGSTALKEMRVWLKKEFGDDTAAIKKWAETTLKGDNWLYGRVDDDGKPHDLLRHPVQIATFATHLTNYGREGRDDVVALFLNDKEFSDTPRGAMQVTLIAYKRAARAFKRTGEETPSLEFKAELHEHDAMVCSTKLDNIPHSTWVKVLDAAWACKPRIISVTDGDDGDDDEDASEDDAAAPSTRKQMDPTIIPSSDA